MKRQQLQPSRQEIRDSKRNLYKNRAQWRSILMPILLGLVKVRAFCAKMMSTFSLGRLRQCPHRFSTELLQALCRSRSMILSSTEVGFRSLKSDFFVYHLEGASKTLSHDWRLSLSTKLTDLNMKLYPIPGARKSSMQTSISPLEAAPMRRSSRLPQICTLL